MFLSCRNPVTSFDIDEGVFPCCVTFVYAAHHLHGINDYWSVGSSPRQGRAGMVSFLSHSRCGSIGSFAQIYTGMVTNLEILHA
jgi:hypothetical protein